MPKAGASMQNRIVPCEAYRGRGAPDIPPTGWPPPALAKQLSRCSIIFTSSTITNSQRKSPRKGNYLPPKQRVLHFLACIIIRARRYGQHAVDPLQIFFHAAGPRADLPTLLGHGYSPDIKQQQILVFIVYGLSITKMVHTVH